MQFKKNVVILLMTYKMYLLTFSYFEQIEIAIWSIYFKYKFDVFSSIVNLFKIF